MKTVLSVHEVMRVILHQVSATCSVCRSLSKATREQEGRRSSLNIEAIVRCKRKVVPRCIPLRDLCEARTTLPTARGCGHSHCRRLTTSSSLVVSSKPTRRISYTDVEPSSSSSQGSPQHCPTRSGGTPLQYWKSPRTPSS